MPPSLALLVWLVLLLALFRFDPAREPGISWAVWVPVIWLVIVGSRLPSQWLGAGIGQSATALEEGNALDRGIYLLLILLAIATLTSRSLDWGRVFATNVTLTVFLVYCLVSVLWSDYPFIAFKRWIRDLGPYLVILVALSDPRPSEAVSTLMRRVCYLLIPLSVMLIKYYPELAKEYNAWTGVAYFSGVATSKNMLGVLCLFSGLFFFWDTLARLVIRTTPRGRRIIAVNVALLAMTLWLLDKADSATSSVCLALGCAILAVARLKSIRRYPALLTSLIPAGILTYLLLDFVFEVNLMAVVAQSVGRNPDLTGRTNIWNVVLAAGANPIVGTGYESFWLGPRLQWVREHAGGPNQAHNGYLEVYLNLGLVGLVLLLTFLIVSYRTIHRSVGRLSSFGTLSLALWTVLLFYNVTESAFRSHLLWIGLLLGTVAVPRRSIRYAIAGTAPQHPLKPGPEAARGMHRARR